MILRELVQKMLESTLRFDNDGMKAVPKKNRRTKARNGFEGVLKTELEHFVRGG